MTIALLAALLGSLVLMGLMVQGFSLVPLAERLGLASAIEA